MADKLSQSPIKECVYKTLILSDLLHCEKLALCLLHSVVAQEEPRL